MSDPIKIRKQKIEQLETEIFVINKAKKEGIEISDVLPLNPYHATVANAKDSIYKIFTKKMVREKIHRCIEHPDLETAVSIMYTLGKPYVYINTEELVYRIPIKDEGSIKLMEKLFVKTGEYDTKLGVRKSLGDWSVQPYQGGHVTLYPLDPLDYADMINKILTLL